MLTKSCFFTLAHLALAMPLWASAQVQLTAPADRITDTAIQKDHAVFQQAQSRLQVLNSAGRPLGNYHLAKAQCWLDVSLHEYTRNDRSAFPQLALEQSLRLAAAMETQTPLPQDTPLVNGAARLRPDLWGQAQALQQHVGFRCVQQQVACAEVELVHAGNEHQQLGWRHAAPYVQMAEDLLAQATEGAAQCVPAAQVVVQQPAPALPVPIPAPQEVRLTARVLFVFDGGQDADVLAISRQDLAALAAEVRRRGIAVESVVLTGHADRLNDTRNRAYNTELSQRRVQTVQRLLAGLGLPEQVFQAQVKGDSQPLTNCSNVRQGEALRACLQSNRRVEVELSGWVR